MRKTLGRRCLAALFTLVLFASLIPAVLAAAPADSFKLNKTSLSPFYVGQTETLRTENGTGTVTWSSSNTRVATVDSNGKVTGVGGGTATITAKNGTDTATCAVSVENEQVTSIEVTLAGVTPPVAPSTTPTKTLTYGEHNFLEVAKVEATWNSYEPDSSGGTKQKTSDVTDSTRLSCSATGGGGVVSISQPPKDKGLVPIPIDAIGQGTTTVILKVDYENRFTKEVISKSLPIEITVGSTTKVFIEDYTVPDDNINFVTMTKDTNKPLKAYVTIDSVRQEELEDQKIVWSTNSPSLISFTPTTGSSVSVNPKEGVTATAKDNVTITATYYAVDGTTVIASKTVTCIIKDTSSGDGTGGDTTDPPVTGDKLPNGVIPNITINTPANGKILEPGSESIDFDVSFKKPDETSVNSQPFQTSRDGYLIATYVDSADNNKRYEVPIVWESDKPAVADVELRSGKYYIVAKNPGKATITLGVAGTDKSASVEVEVSGFELLKKEVEVEENKTLSLEQDGIIRAYGNADITQLSVWSDAANIASYVENKIAAYSPGEANFTVSDTKRGFRDSFKVTVGPDKTSTLPTSGTIVIKRSETLPFTDRRLTFSAQAGGNLSHITGLNVDPAKGTLYYKYKSESQPGSGVGAESYYLNPPTSGQRAIKDLVFVPNPTFPGGEVTISYTAVSKSNQNYSCKILVTVEPEGGDSAAIALETDYNSPLKFTGTEFNRVCQERLGSKLNYVIFSQPPERQGKLYTNYTGTGNYGSVVDTSRRYTLKELDTISFVPAPGYSGPVTVYYTAYGTGSSGSYAGQVSINVKPEGGVAISGLAYDIPKGGVAHFDDEDFNDYCREILYEENRYDRQTLSFIRFDALPSESEGVLYYDYRSSANMGTRAVAGTSYYYGTRTPRIDRLAFVAAEGFTGTVKIPFTGWTADGTSFGGNVEINVRSGTGSGDIYYTCLPGRTVSFRASDFTSLSNRLTGRTIDYIVFRGLPSSVDGTLYYGSSRITTTGTQYRNSNIGRLSFRAANTFSGVVDIPFEGRSASGATFQGVITIGTNASGSSGSSSGSSIRYNADSGTTAVFARVDFDDLSRWQTDRSVSSVRFTPPSSSQGSLYRNYRSGSNMGTRITSDTSINASDLDRVAFVPASGFNGTAYIDFTATASSNGGTFAGTVEVVVGRYGSNFCYFSDMYGYSDAQQAAVNFLYDRGITHGLTATQYGPQNSIRRGDFARMIYQAFSFSPSGVGQAFVDVAPGVYYAEAVNALYSRGVVSGVGGGYYAPDSTLTRQDAICMVQRAMRVTGRVANDGNTSALYNYSDGGGVAGYAQGAMAFAVQNGYLPTYGNWLNPTQPLTRVDMAEILYRVLNG